MSHILEHRLYIFNVDMYIQLIFLCCACSLHERAGKSVNGATELILGKLTINCINIRVNV